MKYYELKSSKKSHSDYPNPTTTEYFSARDQASYDAAISRLTKGCEDWTVREISQSAFRRILEQ